MVTIERAVVRLYLNVRSDVSRQWCPVFGRPTRVRLRPAEAQVAYDVPDATAGQRWLVDP